MNKGEFKGFGLNELLNKENLKKQIPNLYEEKNMKK